jgi:hypothetical protein
MGNEGIKSGTYFKKNTLESRKGYSRLTKAIWRCNDKMGKKVRTPYKDFQLLFKSFFGSAD